MNANVIRDWGKAHPEIRTILPQLENCLLYKGPLAEIPVVEILYAFSHWDASRYRSPVYIAYVSCRLSLSKFAKKYILPMGVNLTTQDKAVLKKAFEEHCTKLMADSKPRRFLTHQQPTTSFHTTLVDQVFDFETLLTSKPWIDELFDFEPLEEPLDELVVALPRDEPRVAKQSTCELKNNSLPSIMSCESLDPWEMDTWPACIAEENDVCEPLSLSLAIMSN